MTEKTQKLKILNRDAIKYLAIIPMAIGHFFSYVPDWETLSPIPLWLKLLTTEFFTTLNIFFTLFLGVIALTIWKKDYSLKKKMILIVFPI